jgi:N6-adenosine-specific RNA methylase IME4
MARARRQPKGQPAASGASATPNARGAREGSGAPDTGMAQPVLWPLDRLSAHPRSALVPALTDKEYRAFRSDVAERGLQVPLAITSDGVVLDGHQRLRAATELGLETVPVGIVAPADEIEYMLLAALRRRQLSPSQLGALVVELLEVRQASAQASRRSQANLRQGQACPEVAKLPPRGRTREMAADLAGVSPRTVQDALTVYRADRALFDQVKAGNVVADVAARRVRRALRDEGLRAAPPLPEGPFDVIYADPPWQLGNADGRYAPEQHYPTLSLEEIRAIAPPTAENAVLFLWAVNCRLREALALIEAWGFDYGTNLVWVKPSIGLGNIFRNRHELLLFGRRGNLHGPDPEDRVDSVLEAARGRHSEKPEVVYELIERMYPEASKLELFARGAPRPGWVAWGNEVETA